MALLSFRRIQVCYYMSCHQVFVQECKGKSKLAATKFIVDLIHGPFLDRWGEVSLLSSYPIRFEVNHFQICNRCCLFDNFISNLGHQRVTYLKMYWYYSTNWGAFARNPGEMVGGRTVSVRFLPKLSASIRKSGLCSLSEPVIIFMRSICL